MYFKPAVATSLGQALYPCAISDEVCNHGYELLILLNGKEYKKILATKTV